MTDWFNDPENSPSTPVGNASWMRLYIVLALIGAGALGALGGMLHVLPA